jgi:hypothetical protein
MALARSGTPGSAAGTSISFTGTYSIGHLIIVHAVNTSGLTVPTVPAGWNSTTLTASANGMAMCIGWKNAASSSETSGTWTNATALSYVMYSGHNPTTPIINGGGQTGTASTTISYSGIVTFTNPNVDWTICTSALSNNSGSSSTHPPTATSLVTDVGASTYESTIFDTNGTVASFSFSSKTLGAAVNSLTKTFELQAATSTFIPRKGLSVMQAVNRASTY